METTPYLTILILTYNQVDSIANAIDSVLAQETSYPHEIWICDDCSTDGTLEICQDYANRYKDRIRLFPQPVNTFSDPNRIFHLIPAIMRIKSKYLCGLEGDDAWCDPKKIQVALDFLETHPEYVTFAHDTLVNNTVRNTKKSLIHEVLHANPINPVTFEKAPLFHTSARIYRNVVTFTEKSFISDIHLFYTYMDKGPLYFFDKIMSVYNFNGKGVWSVLDSKEGSKMNALTISLLNKYFDYRYDDFFTKSVGKPPLLQIIKKLLGRKNGWWVWHQLQLFQNRRILEKIMTFTKYGKKSHFLIDRN